MKGPSVPRMPLIHFGQAAALVVDVVRRVGRVKRGTLQDCESSQLLLCIREGAILYPPLSILQSHRGPGLRGLQWIAADVDVGFDERFVVRPPRAEVGIIVVRISCRKSFW